MNSLNEVQDNQLDISRSISGVFGWMFIGLLVSALTAIYTVNTPSLLRMIYSSTYTIWILFIVEIGLVIGLSSKMHKLSTITMTMMFMLFSIVNGMTLSIIFLVYTTVSIYVSFIVSAGMFGVMAVYGLITKKDLTTMGSYFLMGLVGILLLSISNVFIRSDMLDLGLSLVGIIIFVGLTAYDTQKIKNQLSHVQNDTRLQGNIKIYGALTLYLDFINIFLKILRVMGKSRN